jgi:D-serine deaminase-like pyridoxal phosphate-dependent protein
MFVDELPTPCLLVEAARLERNLARMQQVADANDVVLRPHAKTHKSLVVARRQQEYGARGLTVAKVGEAEVFVGAGVEDVRLAYPVVGRDKHERLLRLMDRARITFCVDTVDGAQGASAFYAAHDVTADVVLEVDTGHGRCGVPWDAARSVRTARQIAELPGLRLIGILTHAGHAYHGPQEGETPEAALTRVAAEERDRMLAFAGRLQEAGLATPGAFEISIGSTPTMAAFENAERDGFRITEIRPGNYVYYDAMQVSLGAATLDDCALTVEATVVSKHRDRSGQDRLYLDAGKKVLTADTGVLTDGYGIILYNPADMVPQPHARLTGLSEEHGWVEVRGGATFGVGDRVRIVPNHACVTVHTQDTFYLVDDGEVVAEHPVDARGCSV